MTTKNHQDRNARDTAPPHVESQRSQHAYEQQSEIPETQEDVLILLAQQIQARREPSRYLDGWIRRFVRG